MRKVILIIVGIFLVYTISLVTAEGCNTVLGCGVGEVCEHNECVTKPAIPPVQNYVPQSSTADNTGITLIIGLIIILSLIIIIYLLFKKKKQS